MEFNTRQEMLVNLIPKNGIYAEIGIFKGDFAKDIINILNPTNIYLIDIFEGNCCSGNQDGNNVEWYDLNKSYYELIDLYKNVNNVNIIKGDSSKVLLEIDNIFDMIYIDGDHSYEGCKKDLESAYVKIKNGGYICGHDYEMNMNKAQHYYNFGVNRAVNEFCLKYNLKIDAKALDGCVSYAIKINKENTNRDILINTILKNNFSMISKERLINCYNWCKKYNNTDYSFVECGVARGGCLALMKYISGEKNKIFGFDSFEGMPNITNKDIDDNYNKSNIFTGFGKVGDNLSGGIENVYQTFSKLNISLNNVIFVKGFFNETLNNSENIVKLDKIAVLRLDGDWYESVKICLEKLYDQVIIGGVIIIDDYGHWVGAKNAVDEFRNKLNITSPLLQTDYTEHYWIKL